MLRPAVSFSSLLLSDWPTIVILDQDVTTSFGQRVPWVQKGYQLNCIMARFDSQRMRVSPHLLPSTPVSVTKEQTAGGGRLKGKARVQAKKKAKGAPNKPAPQKEGPRYIIEIKDFVPLAESISNYNKPALAIPQAFFSTLNRIIIVRNGFSEQLFRYNEKLD